MHFLFVLFLDISLQSFYSFTQNIDVTINITPVLYANSRV